MSRPDAMPGIFGKMSAEECCMHKEVQSRASTKGKLQKELAEAIQRICVLKVILVTVAMGACRPVQETMQITLDTPTAAALLPS